MRTIPLHCLTVLALVGCSGSLPAPGDGAGGSTATGGASGGGGTPSNGGAATGGTTQSGGAPSDSGGTPSTSGGAGNGCTNVRPTGTEWDEATCDQWATETSECSEAWMVDNNYCSESCNRCNSNGTGGTSSGGGPSGAGGSASGGASSGGSPSNCAEPDTMVCDNGITTHCGYTTEYWKDQGTGCMTNTADGFSVEWNDINNLLGRKGLRPGSMEQIISYEADYQPNGNSYLCAYGWTRSPLVEYYIVDSWGTWRPPGGEGHMGTVTSDDGTYDIYRTQRVNQPSIDGTATFYQYWSVRTQKRTSGTITVANHFNAWANLGMNMGNLYEVSLCVEGYQSSGKADVSVSMR